MKIPANEPFETDFMKDEIVTQRGLEDHFLHRAIDLAANSDLDASVWAMDISRTAGCEAEELEAKATRMEANASVLATSLLKMINGWEPIFHDEAARAAVAAHSENAGPIMIIDSHSQSRRPLPRFFLTD